MPLLRSFLKLLLLCGREAARAVACLVGGETHKAADHVRLLSHFALEDLVQLALMLQRVMRRSFSPGQPIDRVLLVKLDRLGDMANATPVFDALIEAFPGVRIDVVGHPGPLALLVGDERVAERLPYRSWLYHELSVAPPTGEERTLLRTLFQRRYPLVVLLRPSLPFLLLGLASRFAATHFVEGELGLERNLKAVEPFVGRRSGRVPRLHVDPAAVARWRRRSGPAAPLGPRVAIHAAANAVAREWPPERYAEVADRLREELDADVRFYGALDERPKLERVRRAARREHRFEIGLPLAEVVAGLAASDVFIGNDSGLAHMAAATGTPVVVVWGGANLSMARPAAPAARCRILVRDLACRATCPEYQCTNPEPLACLVGIAPAEVFAAACDLLTQSRPPSEAAPVP